MLSAKKKWAGRSVTRNSRRSSHHHLTYPLK